LAATPAYPTAFLTEEQSRMALILRPIEPPGAAAAGAICHNACLDRGLPMVQPMTLMTIGLYNEPQGAYLPSILF
jgi:hypothetical protein